MKLSGILTIDASDLVTAKLSLDLGKKNLSHKFTCDRNLSERLTGEMKKFFTKEKIAASDIKKIAIIGSPEHFSRNRTVVATANALAYGWGLKQSQIEPTYSKAPNITLSKRTA